jgi:malonyl CoA-acyl carrier protein transacylase
MEDRRYDRGLDLTGKVANSRPDELLKPARLSLLERAEFSQPLCTSLQVALVNLLGKLGVSPSAVVGHSSGEIAGAYAAGALTQDEAIIVAYYRGFVTKDHKRKGRMVAVGLGRQEMKAHLVPGVVVACENSASSVTLSGDADKLDFVLERLRVNNPDVFMRPLRVDIAYHSRKYYPAHIHCHLFKLIYEDHMQELGPLYQSLTEGHVVPRSPKLPFYSTVTGKLVASHTKLDAMYWRQNMESPVLFNTALSLILRDPEHNSVHLEIGPHAALAGPLRQIYKTLGTTTPYISTISRNLDCTESFLKALGQLHCSEISINFAALYPGGKTLPNLPNYPWNHSNNYWDESRIAKEWRLRKHLHHDVLGSRVAEGNDIEPTWRNVLRLDDVPWIKDHLVHTDVVYPAAGYVAIVGAAIRQLTGMADYTVRDMTINTALVLQSSRSTEVITSLRPSRLTASLDSSWYSWSIVSYNGSSWFKHCSGEVKGGPGSNYPLRTIKSLAREVQSARWYQAIKKIGLHYGPAFIGLADITSGAMETTCAATVLNIERHYESPYALHPATIDLIFQGLIVAACKGKLRLLDQLCLPTYIEELYIGGTTAKEIPIYMDAIGTPRQGVDGDGYGIVDGQVVFHLKSLKLSPLGEQNAEVEANPHAAVQLVWKPHIDLLDPSTLMRPSQDIRASHTLIEKLGFLCMIETCHALDNVVGQLDHSEKYHAWLKKELKRGGRGENPLVEDAKRLLELTPSERKDLIESLIEESEDTESRCIAVAISRIHQSAHGIFEATIDPLDLLLGDNILTELYNFINIWDSDDFFELLSHNKPKLKILEVGAGTGSLSAIILNSLQSKFGERMYSEYTYTDISAGFHIAAKKRFKDYSGIEYAVLDIGKDPIEQGFQEGSYDIIVAANVWSFMPMCRYR